MPKSSVLVSSMSGEVIPPRTGARVRIVFWDPDRVDMRADLTDAELEPLLKKIKAEEVDPRPARRRKK